MSGVLKSVGKIFKSVVKVVKKIALPALAIGALVLTGGAAIGALPSLGTMIGGLGLSSGVTSALTAAVSTAAKGALVGGVTSAISGGNVLQGAGMGAGVGFAAGGLLGAGGLLAKGATAATGAGGVGGTAAAGSAIQNAGAVVAGGGAAPVAAGVAGAAAPVASAGGGLLSNPLVLGQIITGAGQGLGNAMAAKDQRKFAEDERRRVEESYAGGLGLLASDGYVSADPNRPTPSQRYDPFAYRGQYQFDQNLGRVVFVPNPAPGA